MRDVVFSVKVPDGKRKEEKAKITKNFLAALQAPVILNGGAPQNPHVETNFSGTGTVEFEIAGETDFIDGVIANAEAAGFIMSKMPTGLRVIGSPRV